MDASIFFSSNRKGGQSGYFPANTFFTCSRLPTCLEAAGIYHFDLCIVLHDAGVNLMVVNPKPGTLLKSLIPIRCEHWDVSQPGFVEAGAVTHCGNSLAGDFVWSLTITDIFTGWAECRAT